MKICSVLEELFNADGQTDMTNLIVAFCSFANWPKSWWTANSYPRKY